MATNSTQMENLAYFVAEEMKILEKEHFSIGNGVMKGSLWIKDLFRLKDYFEVGIENRDIDTIQESSRDLLKTCRSHLYHIDRRLLSALKELDHASDFIVRIRT